MAKLGMGCILALVLVFSPVWAGAADFKVGIVDSTSILGQSAEGKRVQDNLKRKRDELSKDLQRQDRELGRMMEDFRKQAGVMKEAAKKQRQEELSKRASAFQRKVADADNQLAKLEQKEMSPLLQKLKKAVQTVAQENKLDLVLDKRHSGLLFMNATLDITDKVRSRFGR
jgi:outer membrane protein